MMDIRTRFAEEATEWANKKVPYRHRGITEDGCDCSGMIVGILQKLGKVKRFKLRKYKMDWNLHAGACDIITAELLKVGDFVDNMKIGDVLIFRFGKCDAHAGIYVGGNRFVHSVSTSKYCKFGMTKNSPWSKRLSGIIRLNDEKLAKYS